MASLSNINGLFDVHSTGAILFSTSHGTSGQILRSNGNAAPTWIPQSDIVGAYLPLAGGTLTGATATASGISFTVGGTLSGSTATFSGNVQAPTFNGLAINTTGTNNVANQIVRTEANGYVNFGWINTVSGASNGTINRIYASQDAYIRYMTPASFRTQITDPYYAPVGTVSGVTSVTAGNGLAGGTITTTGTLSTVHLPSFDTRSINPDPEDYGNLIRFDFKSNSTNGLSDGGTYNGQMTWRAYGGGSDMSGGYPIRLAYTASGNLWRQMGTGATSWGAWNKFAVCTGTTSQYIRGDGSIVNFPTIPPDPTGVYLPLAGGTMTGSINLNGSDITNAGNIYNNGWFRNNNATEGLYNQATGNHWYSTGAYWDTGYNGTQGIRLRNGHNGAIMGYLYSETSGEFGLLDKDGNWTFRTNGVNATELRCNNVTGFQMDASGYLTFPVNLNLGTTAPTKVFMSNNTQVKTCDLATARAQFNLSNVTFRRLDHTTDSNYLTGTFGWGATSMDSTLPGYGSGFFDVWSNPAGQPSGTSHWNGYTALHYKASSSKYGYQVALGAGDPTHMYVRGIWGGTTWGSWYRMHNDKSALIKINNQVSISTYNDRNLKIQGASSSDAGITGYAGNGGHLWQLYGSGNDYGFLNGNWAAWDLRKTKNGNLYLNNQSTYYLNPPSTSTFNDVRANIYYDQANTAYYTRPASSSYINTLHTAGQTQVGSSGNSSLYLGNTSGNYFRFHTNNSDTYFDANVGNIYWRQGASTRFYFYMTTANMTINGSLTQNSDVRVKENIIEISNCIDKVKAIRGVYYNRTDFNTKATKVGVVAQEVEKVLPEVILEAPDTGLKSVAYAELTPVLINAIKEQQVMIDDLKSRLKELENK